MTFIERVKYAYSIENIKNCFREYPILAPLAVVGDLIVASAIIALILWGTGVIG